MGLVEGSGICIATSSLGVNSPVTVTPMPSRQRSVERPQTCASSPRRDAVTHTSESNGRRGLRRCSGWRSLALEPNMAIAGRDSAWTTIKGVRHYTTKRIKDGTMFICVCCEHHVTTLDLHREAGNLRTQAATAINRHAAAVHGQPMAVPSADSQPRTPCN